MSEAENCNQYLPSEVLILLEDVGSIWRDSVEKGYKGIYGVDSVAKNIWRINNDFQVEIISTFKVEKFLIDNLDMSEFTKTPYIGHINIKTHYNAFKKDIIFTYYNDKPIYNDDNEIVSWENGTTWGLCFNEMIDKFVTFQDWIPLMSENIDNIFFSFDRDEANNIIDKPDYTDSFFDNLNRPISKEVYDYYISKQEKHLIDKAFNSKINIITIKNTSGYNVYKYTCDLSEFVLNQATEFGSKLYGISFYVNTNMPSFRLGISFYSSGLYYSKSVLITPVQDTWQLATILLENCDITDYTQVKYTISNDNGQLGNIQISEPIFKALEGDQYNTLKERVHLGDIITTNVHYLVELNDTDYKPYYMLRSWENNCKLWKHGQAGIYDNQGIVKPTHWYGKQHEFNFEFIAKDEDIAHKVFNNLFLISNKAEPMKFEFEVVGEVYNWHPLKPVIKWINDKVKDSTFVTLDDAYYYVLTHNYQTIRLAYGDYPVLNVDNTYIIPRIPYLKVTDAKVPTLDPFIIGQKQRNNTNTFINNDSDICLVYDSQLNELRIHTEQLATDIVKYGRLLGNMQYLEDWWKVEIRPLVYKYAYINDGELKLSNYQETRLRDKYIKIKIRYSGTDLAIIQGIITLFEDS